ncbi:hypothetical protein Pan44_03960 [Caulifigura coniformis]|uniref:DUF3301 domain-containing protein n=1 Tax=Caulifigura coniformis TaxID=2527983 RepID=A0A517S8D4_9PLAN|nr:hypothetical protein Pan44_03960 [Caulifigura coniformis]
MDTFLMAVAFVTLVAMLCGLMWCIRALERMQFRRYLASEGIPVVILRHVWYDPPKSVQSQTRQLHYRQWYEVRFPDGTVKWAQFQRHYPSEAALQLFDP